MSENGNFWLIIGIECNWGRLSSKWWNNRFFLFCGWIYIPQVGFELSENCTLGTTRLVVRLQCVLNMISLERFSLLRAFALSLTLSPNIWCAMRQKQQLIHTNGSNSTTTNSIRRRNIRFHLALPLIWKRANTILWVHTIKFIGVGSCRIEAHLLWIRHVTKGRKRKHSTRDEHMRMPTIVVVCFRAMQSIRYIIWTGDFQFRFMIMIICVQSNISRCLRFSIQPEWFVMMHIFYFERLF